MVMIRMGALALAVGICGVLAGPSPAPAIALLPRGGHYQVDPALGDDNTGTGSRLQPFRTITRALAAAQPGEIVFLRPGVYDERVVTVQPGVTVTGPRGAVLRGAATSA